MLVPFLRKDLDILFIGLNPAKTSSDNGHYFSTNSALWKQLYRSGLVTYLFAAEDYADAIVFGGTEYNYNHWQYGITDLLTHVVDSDSRNVRPKQSDSENLAGIIRAYNPKVVVILHAKVYKAFVEKYCGKYFSADNKNGKLGKILSGSDATFFNVPFPHGNAICEAIKIDIYKEIKLFLADN